MQLVALMMLAAAGPIAPEMALAKPAVEATPVLTDEVIRKAVRETIAEDPWPPRERDAAGLLRAGDTVSARMSVAFEQAKVPDCLHDDALKLQPARIGVVNVVGPYSLPWVIAAVVRGKCR